MTAEATSAFGRADADGNVYVIVDGTERYIGQFQGATPEDALAFFTRKFDDLAGQVKLLEQRAIRGMNASTLHRSVETLRTQVNEAAVVGDLASLTGRLDKLAAKVDALSATQAEQRTAAIDSLNARAAAIVERVQALASAQAETVHWKRASAELTGILDDWRALQQGDIRLPKRTADEYWHQIRAARNEFERRRRAFFAELDEQHKTAKTRKQEIIAAAQGIDPSTPDATRNYRALLDDWKLAGRAGAKVDDQLWAKFKAVGDSIYAVKKQARAETEAVYVENLQRKEALLARAEALLPIQHLEADTAKFRDIESEWDDIGYVPRGDVQRVEGRLNAVARAFREAKDNEWKASDPELKDRSNAMATQLQEAIAKLEQELATAQASGDSRRIKEAEEALSARREWLKVLGQ